MPDAPLRLYWDSCAFLAYINEEPDRVDVVSGLLERSASGELTIYTSTLSRVEVAFSRAERSSGVLDDETEHRIDALWDSGVAAMVELPAGVTDMARSLVRKAVADSVQLKPYDATHLATALWLSENGIVIDEFHTFDRLLLDNAADLTGLTVCKPHIRDSGRLL